MEENGDTEAAVAGNVVGENEDIVGTVEGVLAPPRDLYPKYLPQRRLSRRLSRCRLYNRLRYKYFQIRQ